MIVRLNMTTFVKFQEYTFVKEYGHWWSGLPPFCLIVSYMSCGTYSLKPTLNGRFLRSFSWQIYFLSKYFPKILLRGIFSFYIFYCWRCLCWTLNRGTILISQNTTYKTTTSIKDIKLNSKI